jgi:hypothetical protein
MEFSISIDGATSSFTTGVLFWSKMNKQDEDNILSMLAKIPVLTTRGRLYVDTDGNLALDTVHMYMGGVGRCFLNTVVGGYSRTDIISALTRMFVQMKRLSTRCITKLDNPYTRGNMRTFQIRTLETTHYEMCQSRLSHSISSVQTLLNTLIIIYATDIETVDHLRAFIQSSREVYKLLLPHMH